MKHRFAWLSATVVASAALALPHDLHQKLQILRYIDLVHIDDGTGTARPTIRFHDVNVQIVNGLGATNGNPGDASATAAARTETNGLGNLYLGYAERAEDDRHTGSHSLVLGSFQHFESFGNLVAGQFNSATGPLASICGGLRNTASGARSVVVGGDLNAASGAAAALVGGLENVASGNWTSIVGGSRRARERGVRELDLHRGRFDQHRSGIGFGRRRRASERRGRRELRGRGRLRERDDGR